MPEIDRNKPSTISNVTLRNSLMTHEIAHVVRDWRHTRISNYEAMKRIEKAVRENREDLYV